MSALFLLYLTATDRLMLCFVAHMQSNFITGRCNKELEFHSYEMDKVKWQYEECDDDSLRSLQLEDIVMPETFEMLRERKQHFFGFGGRCGVCSLN